jgi:hypothetical protein
MRPCRCASRAQPQFSSTVDRSIEEPPWIEGEQIPANRLTDIFRIPPGIPARPPRSALIIGSRGAGKTTFLRHLGQTHAGTVISLSLGSDMASIGQELPRGFLAVESDPTEERQVVGKAVSLAALWMATRAIELGISLDPVDVTSMLPDGLLKRRPRALTREKMQSLRATVDAATLDAFEPLALGRRMRQFATSLGHACNSQDKGPLLILLDRGDNVVPPCLAAVFQLLDQSDSYTAVAAMRPGPSPPPGLIDDPASAAAGDHYDLFTLGARPRSRDWRSFVEASLRAQKQLAAGIDRVAPEIVGGVLTLSRDSVKVAIDVLGRVASAQDQRQEDAALEGLEDIAANLQLSTEGVLRQFHGDVTGLLRSLRSDAHENGAEPGDPCLLSIRPSQQASLLQTTTDIDRFIAVGLRCGAFCLPEGTPWAPGARPQEIEVHPLMLWRPGDGLPRDPGAGIRLSKSSGEVLGRRGGRPKASVFCAYRMQNPTSVTLLRDLAREVRRHPALSAANVSVTNGQTEPGEKWARTIRHRIAKARALVADVTGMRPDVIFEAGFAYGRSTPVIPVVESSAAREAVPRWLTDLQTAIFTEPGGMAMIVNRIVSVLGGSRASQRGQPRPAPGTVVWLRTLAWNLNALEQTRSLTLHEGLVLEVYPSPDDPMLPVTGTSGIEAIAPEQIIEKASRANLLVVSLDGTSADDLMHFVAGAVAARPKTGAEGASRRVLAVVDTDYQPGDLVADSLNRVTEVVRSISVSQVRPEVKRFAESYTKWAKKDS